MKLYLHHLYLLLAVVVIIVCLCSPALITFVYEDLSSVGLGNFSLQKVSMTQLEATTSPTPYALGILLIISVLVSLFTMFVSLFQNFSLQKRSAVFNCCILSGYYIVLLVFVLIMRGDTRMVEMNWPICLPLVSLILTSMSFYSIRTTEAKMLARANNFRLRD